MSSGPSERALEVARAEARELMNGGAAATILTGSQARGDAHAESDLDVRAVGDGPEKTLKRTEEFLVSLSAMSLADNHAAFADPDQSANSCRGGEPLSVDGPRWGCRQTEGQSRALGLG